MRKQLSLSFVLICSLLYSCQKPSPDKETFSIRYDETFSSKDSLFMLASPPSRQEDSLAVFSPVHAVGELSADTVKILCSTRSGFSGIDIDLLLIKGSLDIKLISWSCTYEKLYQPLTCQALISQKRPELNDTLSIALESLLLYQDDLYPNDTLKLKGEFKVKLTEEPLEEQYYHLKTGK